VRRAEQISGEDRVLFLAVARAVISDQRGTLAEQVSAGKLTERRIEKRGARWNAPRLRLVREEPPRAAAPPAADLAFFNGTGGFSADGREYVISTSAARPTPAPWVNVLANAHFGTLVSESGPGYTWSENAHEFRLTPWANDAVSPGSGEAFYLRDEESGEFWSPTPQPCAGAAPCVTRHGFGYSVFEQTAHGICSELTIYVDAEAPVKFSVLRLINRSGRPRRLSATGYVEWVLGDLRPKTA